MLKNNMAKMTKVAKKTEGFAKIATFATAKN